MKTTDQERIQLNVEEVKELFDEAAKHADCWSEFRLISGSDPDQVEERYEDIHFKTFVAFLNMKLDKEWGFD